MGKCKICGKYTYGKYKYCIDCYYSLDENEKEFNEEYNKTIDINQKYPPTHRTEDGHLVRSRAEVIIANYLFNHKIRYIYEKTLYDKLNTNNKCTPDFYLPDYNLYIEYWGKNDYEYVQTRKFKERIYKNNKIKYLSIEQKEVDTNIESIIEKELIKNKRS